MPQGSIRKTKQTNRKNSKTHQKTKIYILILLHGKSNKTAPVEAGLASHLSPGTPHQTPVRNTPVLLPQDGKFQTCTCYPYTLKYLNLILTLLPPPSDTKSQPVSDPSSEWPHLRWDKSQFAKFLSFTMITEITIFPSALRSQADLSHAVHLCQIMLQKKQLQFNIRLLH